jgi:hypothetical protein
MKMRPPTAMFEYGGARQPNELDLRRILRLLRQRTRYRYVAAAVEPAVGGYRIVSPCCSRTIDHSGGIIDIARLEYDEPLALWRLYRKDHARNEWLLHFSAPRLAPLMDCLNDDPARVFWQ